MRKSRAGVTAFTNAVVEGSHFSSSTVYVIFIRFGIPPPPTIAILRRPIWSSGSFKKALKALAESEIRHAVKRRY